MPPTPLIFTAAPFAKPPMVRLATAPPAASPSGSEPFTNSMPLISAAVPTGWPVRVVVIREPSMVMLAVVGPETPASRNLFAPLMAKALLIAGSSWLSRIAPAAPPLSPGRTFENAKSTFGFLLSNDDDESRTCRSEIILPSEPAASLDPAVLDTTSVMESLRSSVPMFVVGCPNASCVTVSGSIPSD